MTNLINRVFGAGSRGALKRYLGHTQNAVSILGSTTNAMNRLGYTNSPLHTAHRYASTYVQPFIKTAQNVLEK